VNADRSNGYEVYANEFAAARGRSTIGAETVGRWAATLSPGGDILELGCGNGVPISKVLIDGGFNVFAIDASPTLVAEFRERFPNAKSVCEAVENSNFFDRKFDAVIAVGLIFLLPEDGQRQIIQKVAATMANGGRFLFTSPSQAVEWEDVVTGTRSVSLGAAAYKTILSAAGFDLTAEYEDEGGNHYHDAILR